MSLDIGKVAIALGALLAYKNKDRIGDWIDTQRNPQPANADPNAPQQRSGGGLLDGIFGGGAGGGLQDILDRFRGAGSGEQVDSWVGKETNRPLEREHVEKAIDPRIIDELSRQTGLSRDELLERIQRDLPSAVDEITPEGSLPTGGSIFDKPSHGPQSGPWADTAADSDAGSSQSTGQQGKWGDAPSGGGSQWSSEPKQSTESKWSTDQGSGPARSGSSQWASPSDGSEPNLLDDLPGKPGPKTQL